MTDQLTQQKLRSLLWYHPETGVFRWRFKRSTLGREPWSEAGHLGKKGYVQIFIGSKSYRAHRLAWLYMTGNYPDEGIDHKNGTKSDNRWENLRIADAMHNQWNASKRKDNTSGVKGVSYSSVEKKWRASCRVGGVRYHLGTFQSVEQAANAVQQFRNEHHGEFARH